MRICSTPARTHTKAQARSSFAKVCTGLVALSTLLLLQGCIAGAQQVKESNRDTSGTFDGEWSVTAVSTAAVQYGAQGNWTLNCNKSRESLGKLVVSDGRMVSNYLRNTKKVAFVSSTGNFKIEQPIEEVAKASGTSDGGIDRGGITLIMGGSLDGGKGFFIVGIEELANDGCTTKVKFTRL